VFSPGSAGLTVGGRPRPNDAEAPPAFSQIIIPDVQTQRKLGVSWSPYGVPDQSGGGGGTLDQRSCGIPSVAVISNLNEFQNTTAFSEKSQYLNEMMGMPRKRSREQKSAESRSA